MLEETNKLIGELREWGMFVLEAGILWVVWLEYKYDAKKDEEKKQKRTKTTKKTTKGVSGETIEETTTETSEPMVSSDLEGINGANKREGKDSDGKNTEAI